VNIIEIPPDDRCRNCGAEFRWTVPARCPLCGAPMLRIVPEPTEPVRHLQVAKEEA
jgi:predicted Zn-ribbon and HTH transcriptional regulator